MLVRHSLWSLMRDCYGFRGHPPRVGVCAALLEHLLANAVASGPVVFRRSRVVRPVRGQDRGEPAGAPVSRSAKATARAKSAAESIRITGEHVQLFIRPGLISNHIGTVECRYSADIPVSARANLASEPSIGR